MLVVFIVFKLFTDFYYKNAKYLQVFTFHGLKQYLDRRYDSDTILISLKVMQFLCNS